MRILLIEDDTSLVELLKILLQLEGHQPSEIINPSIPSVIAEIKRLTPAAVMMDVNLKETSGLDILRSIRASSDLLQPRVVMVSGMPLKEECLAAGADGFLMKPYNPDELIKWLGNG